MTPGIYAMSWFITLFSRKSSIATVLCLWDLMLQLSDPSFVVFIAVVFIHSRRSTLLSAEEALPQRLVAMSFDSVEEVVACVNNAIAMRKVTPNSIIGEMAKLGFSSVLNESEREFGIQDLMVG